MMRTIELCAGIGGLGRAVERVFGAELVAYAEVDKDASKVMARHWPGVPNLGDLKTAGWEPWAGVDIVCGGIPCQPWSSAGRLKRTEDDRHLWPHIVDAIRILRPRFVVLENVPGFLAPGGLDAVLADLCALGFHAEWGTLRASSVGAAHRRERLFVFAWDATRQQGSIIHGEPVRFAGDTQRSRTDAFPTQSPSWSTAGKPSSAVDARVRLLPTPVAQPDGKSPEAHLAMKARMHGGRPSAATDLRVVLQLLPTATARDFKGRDMPGKEGGMSLPTVSAWGDYAEAIARWESVMERPPPVPLNGKQLSPDFVEWLMGFPAGWCDAAPGAPSLSRSARLRLLGNAVVTRQAKAALAGLCARATEGPL